MIRIVRWATGQTTSEGWRWNGPNQSDQIVGIADGAAAWFDLSPSNLENSPNLREALSRNGVLGTIRDVRVDPASSRSWGHYDIVVEFPDD